MWDSLEIGDSTPPFDYEVTAEKVADFCRAARYENLVYTSPAAAREAGLPGTIAPPAMVLVYAPARLSGLRVRQGPGSDRPELDSGAASTVKLLLNSQGVMVSPGDIITSVTSVRDRFRTGEGELITVQVSGRNQRGELVADYTCTYLCPDAGT